MTIVQVKKKAQVTLPKQIRAKLNIEEGDILDVMIEKEAVVMRPRVSDRVALKTAPAAEFIRLSGSVSLGGDAVAESEGVYED